LSKNLWFFEAPLVRVLLQKKPQRRSEGSAAVFFEDKVLQKTFGFLIRCVKTLRVFVKKKTMFFFEDFKILRILSHLRCASFAFLNELKDLKTVGF
jgi:hypothetical protein